MKKHYIKEILQSGRLLMFKNDDKNFEYTLGESAFLLKIENELFAVTAKHVLGNNGYKADDVLIKYNDQSREFLPFEAILGADTSDDEDTDHIDVVFLQVSKQKIDTSINTGFVVELPKKKRLPQLECSSLLITGYPKDLSEIDYQNKHIKEVRKPFLGMNPTPSQYKGIVTFKYQNQESIDCSLNGLSGSPVFCLNDNDMSYRIEGMLVRENYYLSIDIIIQYLFEIMKRI